MKSKTWKQVMVVDWFGFDWTLFSLYGHFFRPIKVAAVVGILPESKIIFYSKIRLKVDGLESKWTVINLLPSSWFFFENPILYILYIIQLTLFLYFVNYFYNNFYFYNLVLFRGTYVPRLCSDYVSAVFENLLWPSEF